MTNISNLRFDVILSFSWQSISYISNMRLSNGKYLKYGEYLMTNMRFDVILSVSRQSISLLDVPLKGFLHPTAYQMGLTHE